MVDRLLTPEVILEEMRKIVVENVTGPDGAEKDMIADMVMGYVKSQKKVCNGDS